MAELPDSDLTGPWETIGYVSTDNGYARPAFGFGNPDDLPDDSDYKMLRQGGPVSRPIRIDPYGPSQFEVPSGLSTSLVLSSVTQPPPDETPIGELEDRLELGIEPEEREIRKVPLEVCKQSDGQVIAARLAYLTELVNDLRLWGYANPETDIKPENGVWQEVGSLQLPTGRCIALDFPDDRGPRIPFQVKPGSYVAEVFVFTDDNLGIYECNEGLRIRWHSLQS